MTRRDTAILGLTEGLLVLPPAIDLATSGTVGAFRYFAADAFYYFTVGRNFARSGIPTFDQTYPTNGFHPFWQLWVALLYKLTLVFSLPETAFLSLAVASCVLLVAAGILLLGLAIRRARGEIPALFVLVPVGVYGFLMLPVWAVSVYGLGLTNPSEGPLPLYGTLWSYMNGMESALAICAFGVLAVAFVTLPAERRSFAIAVGAATSLLVLARLDLALLVAPIALLELEVYRRRGDARGALVFVACSAVPILAYLAINWAYAGVPMPVSGTAKSTFPYLTWENFDLFLLVLQKPFGFGIWLDLVSRFAQILLPALGALAVLRAGWKRVSAYVASGREAADRLDVFVVAVGAGVLVLALYNLFFTKLLAIGHWYFPVSILWLSMVVICRKPADRPAPLAKYEPQVLAAVAIVSIAVFVTFQRQPEYHAGFSQFYFVEAPRVRAVYGNRPPKIVEVDDGIVAFSTDFPAMAGIGLALDPEASKAFRENRQLEICLARGFDRLASLNYGDFQSPEKVEKFCASWINVPPADSHVRLSVEYVSPARDFGIVRLDRVPSDAAP